MTRLLPRGLLGQTLLLLVVGLIGSHLLSMVMYADDRVAALAQAGNRHLAERVAEITRLFEDAPPDWRPRLVRATDSPSLGISLTARPLVGDTGGSDWMTEAAARLMRRSLGLGADRVAVRLLDAQGRAAPAVSGWMQGPMGETWPADHGLQVSVRLEDGAWLNFLAAAAAAEPLWSSRALLSMVLMALGVVALSALAARRLIGPLKTFAEAADRLGKDVAAEPLPEQGPTEIRRAAAAFNRMQERLRRLVENRTRLLAAISHDLRTPITLLKLRSDFIEDEAERARTLATLAEMETMIASTLAFARDDAETEARIPVDLAALVSSLADDLADAGQPVSHHGPDKLPYEGRPGALRRAIVNLVENALRYGGGARLFLEDKGATVELRVEDDGPGIPEDQMTQVFQPFYRVEGSRSRDTGGVGLGLATAQAVAHAHGGEIRLRNRPEGGLSAVLELPR